MKNLLSSSSFLILNKVLARNLGLKESILLSDLISKEEYFIENGMTDGWFFNTEANIFKDTTLTPFQQRKALKQLEKHEIIKIKRKGIPAKLYFKINEQQVIKFLNNLKCNKSTTINKNKEIKTINKYFKKPQVLDVKNYCLERNNSVDPEAFWDFYESKDWFVGKSKMKCWKSAVRNWERREKKNPKKMSKIHQHLQKNLNVKEKLKQKFKK